jgi:hypothetical protein
MLHTTTSTHNTTYSVSDLKATFLAEVKPRISLLPWKHLIQTHHDCGSRTRTFKARSWTRPLVTPTCHLTSSFKSIVTRSTLLLVFQVAAFHEGESEISCCFFLISGAGLWVPRPLYWPIVSDSGDRWGWLWRNWWNEDWQRKPKYSEKTFPSTTLSTTNPTWLDPGLNLNRRGGKPATNRLSYGAAPARS